jgi:sensor histidine kinase regulating citrate/malate metabolism
MNKRTLFSEGFSTGDSTRFGPFLINAMIELYGWQLQETGEAGKNAKFTQSIPKPNRNGKMNFQIAKKLTD